MQNSNSATSTTPSLLLPKVKIFSLIAILLFSFGIYADTILFDYALDDTIVITDNPSTQKGLSGIPIILSQDAFTAHLGEKQERVAGGRYRPLSYITFAIEWEFFATENDNGEKQGNPLISHLINILLYAFIGMIIYYLFNSLLSRDNSYNNQKVSWYLSTPFLTAILFITHPVHTEVVANIKGRDELLMMIFVLLSLQFTLGFLDTKRTKCQIIAVLCFFLALLSKENAITFLAVIPATIYFFTEHPVRKNLKTWIPLFSTACCYLIIRVNVIGSLFPPLSQNLINNPFLHALPSEKYATIMLTWGHYLRLLIFPYTLTFDYYPYHIPLINFPDYRAILPLIIFLTLIALVLKGFRRKTLLSYSLIFFFATFSIVSNLFFPIGAFMNERFVFVPSLAFCLLLAYGLSYGYSWFSKSNIIFSYAAVVLLGAIIILYSGKSVARTGVWENNYTLFTNDVKTSHNSMFSNRAAGREYLIKAVSLDDTLKKIEFFNLAIKHLAKAVTIDPSNSKALFLLGKAHYDYNKNYKKTLEYWGQGLKYEPNNIDIHYRSGILHVKHTKNWNRAIEHFIIVLKQDPDHADSLNHIGAAYYNAGNYYKAIETLEKFIGFNPDDINSLLIISRSYEKIGEIGKAFEYRAKYLVESRLKRTE